MSPTDGLFLSVEIDVHNRSKATCFHLPDSADQFRMMSFFSLQIDVDVCNASTSDWMPSNSKHPFKSGNIPRWEDFVRCVGWVDCSRGQVKTGRLAAFGISIGNASFDAPSCT